MPRAGNWAYGPGRSATSEQSPLAAGAVGVVEEVAERTLQGQVFGAKGAGGLDDVGGLVRREGGRRSP